MENEGCDARVHFHAGAGVRLPLQVFSNNGDQLGHHGPRHQQDDAPRHLGTQTSPAPRLRQWYIEESRTHGLLILHRNANMAKLQGTVARIRSCHMAQSREYGAVTWRSHANTVIPHLCERTNDTRR
eukprot:1666576-Pleurochrysis_carterae.AAC.3